ncbi:DivIVA domain-containing protein [Micromonospora endophytica]|uniref:DivIVA domain-containing protein n=1 Tax=Micromonospora endophytica TaxID=515350 RepID=UPI001C32C38D|nr:DivIVA domain-containing protein [Micromonospora endophytica]BCJ58762.1 hypothetical protein Jiend_21840 [Micromonospora endophytica]
MGQLLLVLLVAVTVAAVVFGVTTLVNGRDPGLVPVEADGRAVSLPGDRPLRESDVGEVRFDTALRGYRMAQVDQALRRAAYDIGYKTELIGVLEAEVAALRQGRTAEADALQRAREQSAGRATAPPDPAAPTTEPTVTAIEPFATVAEPAVRPDSAAVAAGSTVGPDLAAVAAGSTAVTAGSAAAGGASATATAGEDHPPEAGDPTPESGTEFGAEETGEETAAPPGPTSSVAESTAEVDPVEGAAGARGEASTDEPDAAAVRSESK